MLVEEVRVTVGDTGAWSRAISSYCVEMQAAGWSAGTIAVKSKYLRRLQRSVPDALGPFDLTEDDLMAFMACPSWSPETRKSARASLRGFYRWAYETRRMNEDVSGRLPAVKVPPAEPRPAPDAALDAALERSDSRVRLMLLLAARGGLRRAEIAGLHTSHVGAESLRIKGKGGRTREVPIHPDVAEYLRGLPDGYIFPGNDGGHLSPDRVGRLMSQALGPGWTAHTLRHRFATKGYGAGHDLFSLQRVLGHASSKTTERYTATSGAAALAIVMAS